MKRGTNLLEMCGVFYLQEDHINQMQWKQSDLQ